MGEQLYYHLVKKSTNKKTGPIAVLTSSFYTCPDTCPFKRNGCYADGGPLRIHWDKVTEGNRGVTFTTLLDVLRNSGDGQIIRLFQAGDLPGINNNINLKDTIRLTKALKNWKAYGFTHKPPGLRYNSEAIRHCNDNGICINLSANNLTHADKLMDLGIGPVSVTLPKDLLLKKVKTPNKHKVVICPATIAGKTITCSTCGGKAGPICSQINRKFIVGFPAHGSCINKVSKIAEG
jgi:hypothetical protein